MTTDTWTCPVCKTEHPNSTLPEITPRDELLLHLRASVDHLCKVIITSGNMGTVADDVRVRAQRSCSLAERLRYDIENNILF